MADWLQAAVAVGTGSLAFFTWRLARATRETQETEQVRFDESMARREAEMLRQDEVRRFEHERGAAVRLINAIDDTRIDMGTSAPPDRETARPMRGTAVVGRGEVSALSRALRNGAAVLDQAVVRDRVFVAAEMLKIYTWGPQQLATESLDPGYVWVLARYCLALTRGALVALISEQPPGYWDDFPPSPGMVLAWLVEKKRSGGARIRPTFWSEQE